MDNLREEKKLWKKRYRVVIGMDEAGRGSLGGPVVAAAVAINSRFKIKDLTLKIRDSKKLTPKKREELYKILIRHPQIEWGIGKVGPKVIDQLNILEATKLAMQRAVNNLEKKLSENSSRTIGFLIIDGNFGINSTLPQKSIIKADEKVFSCIAASIIAKIKRDEMMRRFHKKYPQYGFDKHKGYPTKFHKKQLKKHGLSIIHRKSFKPCRDVLK